MANQSDRPKILGDIGSVPNHQKQCPTCKNDYNKSNYGRILNGFQKGLQNITSSYGHHEKNIEFITSGRRQ